MTTVRAARARNGARKRGFSRTRSNTAVGSNRTRTRSRTAPITASRTKGSPSRTTGTAPNILEKQILRACDAQDDKRAAVILSERAERARSEGSAYLPVRKFTGNVISQRTERRWTRAGRKRVRSTKSLAA